MICDQKAEDEPKAAEKADKMVIEIGANWRHDVLIMGSTNFVEGVQSAEWKLIRFGKIAFRPQARKKTFQANYTKRK